MQFVSNSIQVAPPDFASPLVARLGCDAYLKVKSRGGRRQGFKVIKACLRVGRAHGALKLNKQFLKIIIEAVPPRFA